ncbi:MAG: hypothetical protein WBA93_36090, partial [Microcoleaceae cyanobacterium]
ENNPESNNKNKIIAKIVSQISVKAQSLDGIDTALVFLQSFSLTTTIQGLKIVLPKMNPIFPFIVGGVIQFILVALLIFQGKSQSIVRRWTMIILFTGLSIYTSFFCFYNAMLGGELEENSPKKIQAHENLKGKIYTPIKSELERLESRKKTLEIRLNDELNGGRGLSGAGPIYYGILDELDEVKDNIDRIKALADNERIKSVFELSVEEINSLPAKKVYDQNIQAWNSFPAKYKTNVPRSSCSSFYSRRI